MSIEFLEQSVKFGKSETDTVATFIKELETYCGLACEMQRGANWYIGDSCNAAEVVWRRNNLPGTWHQVVPVWASEGLVERCRAVAAAYKPAERNINATWTIHAKYANDPDRVALVAAHVAAGHTSDEARKNPALPPDDGQTLLWRDGAGVLTQSTPALPPDEEEPVTTAMIRVEPITVTPVEPEITNTDVTTQDEEWLLAADLNYYVQKNYPRLGTETAQSVCEWLLRVIHRLEAKGVTDVVCCFDSTMNHRRDITVGWEKPYKARSMKDPELIAQLTLLPDLLTRINIPCVTLAGMEADDVMASYAATFNGKVTLLTPDKDLRQCLSSRVNIIRDMTWEPHPETNQMMAVYELVVAQWDYGPKGPDFPKDPDYRKKPTFVSCHMTDGVNYSRQIIRGIPPELWAHFQAIAGDSTDDIGGVKGVGAKGAADLIRAHGTVQEIIAACKDNRADLSNTKRLAVLDFEQFAEATLLLTTMRTDLPVPMVTKLNIKADYLKASTGGYLNAE
jgi:5'-3' exonuclease